MQLHLEVCYAVIKFPVMFSGLAECDLDFSLLCVNTLECFLVFLIHFICFWDILPYTEFSLLTSFYNNRASNDVATVNIKFVQKLQTPSMESSKYIYASFPWCKDEFEKY